VKGNEANNIDYLTPKWMEMLKYVEDEGKRLGIQIDMNNGTGWPFGGPTTPIEEAACKAVVVDTIVTKANFDKGIDFVPHRGRWIPNNTKPVISLCKTGNKIYVTGQQHIIEIAKAAIDILIGPTGIFRELTVVFIGVAVLDLTVLRALLEDFILVITYPDNFRSVISQGGKGNACDHQHDRTGKDEKPAQRCPAMLVRNKPH
jgi:hypothetical protein